jgi:ABC-type transport system substrate-binding protein
LDPALTNTVGGQHLTLLILSHRLAQLPDLPFGMNGAKPDQRLSLPDESPDLMTTTPHLAGHMKWSDGQPAVAEDWLLAIDLCTDPNVGGDTSLPIPNIATIAKADATAIAIHWKAAFAPDLAFTPVSFLTPMPTHSYPMAFSGSVSIPQARKR